MFFVLSTLIFLLGIFLVVKKVRNNDQKKNFPPGPWGLPLLGHLVSLGLNPHLTLIEWKKKYGPIISCRFGSFQTVVLCDSKVIKEAFNAMEFSGRPQFQVFVENKYTQGIAFSEGSYQEELRQFAIRKLKEFGVGRKSLECQIHEGISEFMDFIKMREKLPIKSVDIPSAHIIKTLWSIMMTDDLNPEEIEYMNRLIKTISQLGPVLSELAGFMPWLENLSRILSFGRFSLISSRSKQINELFSFLAKLLQTKKRNRVRDQSQGHGQGQGQGRRQSLAPADVMDFYLEKVEETTTDKSSPFHPSQDSATYFLADIFGAGIHTAHTSLVWMLNFMARNREVQLKLQEEIDKVTGSGSGNDLSRLPFLSDRGQMPYAEAIVNEVLRLSPPLPLLLPHKTTKDVRFHGYDIKKDTMIFANAYGVHYDPEIWGDPKNFRPERWLGEAGKKLKNDHFLPFSSGKRICLGEAFGREQLFLYITTLFQKYSVKFDLGKVPEVKGVIGIFLEPSKFTVIFNQRQNNKS